MGLKASGLRDLLNRSQEPGRVYSSRIDVVISRTVTVPGGVKVPVLIDGSVRGPRARTAYILRLGPSLSRKTRVGQIGLPRPVRNPEQVEISASIRSYPVVNIRPRTRGQRCFSRPRACLKNTLEEMPVFAITLAPDCVNAPCAIFT